MRAVALVCLFLLAAAVPSMTAEATSCSPSGPSNDCLSGVFEWFGKRETYSNAGATMESGEPALCEGVAVHNSVWFKVEVVSPGSWDTLGIELEAPFYATLGLYEQTSGGGLSQISCDTSTYDEGLWSPRASAPCEPGRVYWIQVGGMDAGQQGSFVLRERHGFYHFNLTPSEECWFKPTLPTEPRVAAPQGGNGEVLLSWVEPWWDGGRTVSVSHYNVHRAGSCAGPFALLGSTPHRSYRDSLLPPNATYCYKVTAVNPVGEGPAEPGRSAKTWDYARPPRSLAVAPEGDGGLRLAWQPSPDASGPAGMTGHRVYRAASAEGPYEAIATVGATATGFTDAGLGRGVAMHYRVSAVNVVGEGAWSDPASATTYRVPGAPRDVTIRHVITLEPVSFEISWRPPSDPAPFTEYRVYRAASPDGAPQFIGAVPHTATRFVDGFRGPFLDYHYEVRASNPAGEGASSARACYAFPLETALGRCG